MADAGCPDILIVSPAVDHSWLLFVQMVLLEGADDFSGKRERPEQFVLLQAQQGAVQLVQGS